MLLITVAMLSALCGVMCAARERPAQGTLLSPSPPLASGSGKVQDFDVQTRARANRELKHAVALRNKLTRRDLLDAIRLFSASARDFAASGAPGNAAYSELEAGDTYLMMSRYQQALAAYRLSLGMAKGQPMPRCAALSHMARVYATIGRNKDAVQRSETAVALCQSAGDQKALADALEAQAEAKFWSADMAGAIALFTRSRQLFSEVHDRDGEALATMMLAEAINAQDREQSGRLARTALDLWTADGNQYGSARAHIALALFASAMGNFGLAQCRCQRALPVFQRVADKDNEAIALNILGMVARQSGDLETSLGDYRGARSDFAAVHDDLGEAESITGIGAALSSEHNFGELLLLYRRKLRLAEKAGNPALVASALADIGGVYSYRRRYGEAAANYQQALARYRKAGNRYGESTVLMRLAELQMEQGNDQEALSSFETARTLKEQTGQVEDLARIQYDRARIYRRLYRLEDARAEIEKTIGIIETQRLRITKFDSRAQYFASVHEYYSLYIQVLMALHQLHPNAGYMKLAFEASERSKVRALLDLLENARQDVSCDELLARDSNTRVVTDGQQPPAKTGAASARPLTLEEIQAEIGDGETVLLEYALGDEKSYVWILDGEKISAHELPSVAEVRRDVRAFRAALMPPPAREYETASQYLHAERGAERAQVLYSTKLAKLLLGHVDIPARSRVLIVPDGPLQYVPFAALAMPEGNTFFIAQHDLTMLPSASALAALRKAAAKRPPPTAGVAIFADPVYEEVGTTASAHLDTTRSSGRPHDLTRALQDTRGSQHIVSLPGSRAEALAIENIVGPERAFVALGFDANRKSVIEGSLAHRRIIHFATHGIVDTRRPEMSGLILSLLNRRGERQDGYLRLSDIYNLKLSADLVVLSSCDSALGKDLESEGIIGLPRGFLYAGARTVIASLWKVDDDASAALMKNLYRRMQQGESPQTALRKSQLELAKDARYRQPYYWAAFVVEGDYRWNNTSSEKVEIMH